MFVTCVVFSLGDDAANGVPANECVTALKLVWRQDGDRDELFHTRFAEKMGKPGRGIKQVYRVTLRCQLLRVLQLTLQPVIDAL